MISLFIERHGQDDSDFEQLKGLINRSGQAEEKRNQITHSIWGAGKDADHITRIKTTAKEKHGIRFQLEEVSPQNLEDFAIEIKSLAHELQTFCIYLLDNGKGINNHEHQRLP